MRLMKGVMVLGGVAALAALSSAALAITVITIQPDGSASVRLGDQAPVSIPASTVGLLQGAFGPGSTASSVQALMSGAACIAPTNAVLTAAIASYALSLAPDDLSEAVVAGALDCNPDAADEIEVAAGPEAPTADAGVVDVGAVGGISGAGSQELPRTGSPNQI